VYKKCGYEFGFLIQRRRSWDVTLLTGKSVRKSIIVRNGLGGLSSNRSDQARITIGYSEATKKGEGRYDE
jgi:hypothetical protein